MYNRPAANKRFSATVRLTNKAKQLQSPPTLTPQQKAASVIRDCHSTLFHTFYITNKTILFYLQLKRVRVGNLV
jgi:hypothetical protein